MTDAIQWMPAWRLAELVRDGRMSATEVCSALLDRIDRLDTVVHSFVTVTPERALSRAAALDEAFARGERSGAFRGVPYSAKDNLFTAGVRSTCGSRLLSGFVPEEDAGSVRRIDHAGAVLVGKANLPEFSSWVRSRNLVAGECFNPWDLTRTAGASSGGSAAAVAAGLVPISIGSDDGGSIRLPAALNGVFGFFPSRGRVPLDNTVVIGSVSEAGPLCRDVRDAATFLAAMAGRPAESAPAPNGDDDLLSGIESGIAGARAAWITEHEGTSLTDARVVEVAHSAARLLGDAGVHVEEPPVVLVSAQRAMPPVTPDNSAGYPGLRPFDLPEFRRALTTPGWQELLSPYIDPERLHPTRSLSQEGRRDQETSRRAVVQQMQELFSTYDLVLTPTIDEVAPVASDEWVASYGGPGSTPDESVASYVKYTLRVNITGCPAATVPCGLVDGLPVGLQIIGRPGADSMVLRASRDFEKLRPWMGSRPAGFD
jgi:Asp-tRNA(Asn)/Glu-tRNA(Gln) amidotransferase A subunit family amidase